MLYENLTIVLLAPLIIFLDAHGVYTFGLQTYDQFQIIKPFIHPKIADLYSFTDFVYNY